MINSNLNKIAFISFIACDSFLSFALNIYCVNAQIKENSNNTTNKACTSFAAGKLATVDGSVMAGHTLDGSFDFSLKIIPGIHHRSDENVKIDYTGLTGGFQHIVRGESAIPEVDRTYTYFHTDCPPANEFQVFFGENTCDTKKELYTLSSEEALLDWTQIAKLALQRGNTAREAIKAAGGLIEKYGLNGVGESFLVSDPKEAWCFEIPGFSNVWVAQRISDDHVCPHTNRMKISLININDSLNFLASPNLTETAQDRGLYSPVRDGSFNFARVYNPDTIQVSKNNVRREWRIFSLLCPSKMWHPDSTNYPFSIKPEKKISVQWWLENIWRDVLEGTNFDKTQGIAAGPFGCPDRPRISELDKERAIGIGEMTYSWVSQSRSWLPNAIGGVLWFGLDCSRSTCYVPFYVGITRFPQSWQKGNYLKFSPESTWWLFQAIDSFSWLRYNEIHIDVRNAFGGLENEFFAAQADVENKAVDLYNLNPKDAKEFLTKCSLTYAAKTDSSALDLFYTILAKYRDGMPKTSVNIEWLKLLNQK